MKPATPALAALLASIVPPAKVIKFDLYYFTLASGAGSLLYTTADFAITAADATIWDPPAITGSGGLWHSGIRWAPGMLDMKDTQTAGHWKVGLDTDSWRVKFVPRQTNPITGEVDEINGVPWLEAAQNGALDNADLIVSTAYFAAMPTHPMPLAGLSPVGTLLKFRGLTGKISASDSAAFINATDYRAILSQAMPRNVYQSSCRHRLYDSRCTLSAASFTRTGTAAAGAPPGVVIANAGLAAPGGSNTFALGVLTMTGGANAGQSRLITYWDGGATLSLLDPFPYPIAAGDTFSATAGCNKSSATCNAFGNILNFGAEPYIPPPEVSTG